MVGPAGGGEEILARVQDIAATAIAAEQVGGAARVLEMAVEYAKIREQFGRHRVVPGHQTSVCRHAAGGRIGPLSRLLRAVGR